METSAAAAANGTVPSVASEAVLVASQPLPEDTPIIQGYDFSAGIDYEKLLASYLTTGFQATNFHLAVQEVRKMLEARDKPLLEEDNLEGDEFIRRRHACTVFLGYTSNMVSSGVREHIRFLVEHKMVDCLVTTAGGVEEDIIKCLAPTYVGSFELRGADLRARGINRIGNLLAPNDNYCKFEDWLMPLLDEMLDEQQQSSVVWSPSRIISRLGARIDDRRSILYWAHVNSIPVFSPALTDGSIGDMLYFHSFRRPGLLVDILSDLRRLNTMAVKAQCSGMVILGGGLVKHHICNANLMRNGADYSVFINTAQEFDGSDAGARPDEAVSWGKIRCAATPVKVHADASLLFPLLVAETFARHHFNTKHTNTKPTAD